MTHDATRIGMTMAFVLAMGCDTGPDDGSRGDDTAADTNSGQETDPFCADPVATTDEEGNILVIAADSLNYTFQSSLEIKTVPVRSSSNLTFDWSGMTEDMFGHPFDPLGSVDMVELMLWRYTKEDLMQDINNDTLDTTDLVVLGQVPTLNVLSSTSLLDIRSPSGGLVEEEELMSYMDTSIYPPEAHTYFIMLAEGDDFGKGTKSISFFDPSPEETNTAVQLANDSTVLEYTADLTSLKRIAVPPGRADIVLDWFDDEVLSKNAMGRQWMPTRITDVQVAHYRDLTPSDLEREFLRLDLIADEMWDIYLLAGQSVNLSRLTTGPDGTGEPFPGIDEQGTWLVALKCESCANPAPLFLSILHPCPE